ncbi:MAG: MlaD family protein [Verrucomicrobiota bacterium]
MKNWTNIVITLLVLVCSTVLLGALIVTVRDNPFSSPVMEFTIDFEDAPGIAPNSQVTYAGQVIGIVDEVQFLEPTERPEDLPDHIIRLHIDVLQETPLPKNLQPSITASSLLGGNLVTLRRIDDEGGQLEDGARLTGYSAGPLDALAPGATEILDGVGSAVAQLNYILGQVGEGGAKEDVTVTLANLRTISETINQSLGDGGGIEELLAKLTSAANQINILFAGNEEIKGVNPQFDEILENTRELTASLNQSLSEEGGVLAKLETTMAGMDRTINGPAGQPDRALHEQIETLTHEVQVLLVYAQYFTGSLAERPKRLLFGDNEDLDVPTKEEILEYLRETGESFPVTELIGEPEKPSKAEKQADAEKRRTPFPKR